MLKKLSKYKININVATIMLLSWLSPSVGAWVAAGVEAGIYTFLGATLGSTVMLASLAIYQDILASKWICKDYGTKGE